MARKIESFGHLIYDVIKLSGEYVKHGYEPCRVDSFGSSSSVTWQRVGAPRQEIGMAMKLAVNKRKFFFQYFSDFSFSNDKNSCRTVRKAIA